MVSTMINIIFKKSNGKIIFFEVTGHANLSDYGTDIVCSAVSSTTLMTINGILEILNLRPYFVLEEGHSLCDLTNVDIESSQSLVKSYYVFIKELARKYPKNLKFKVMEVWNVIKVKPTIICLKKRTRVY